MNYLLFIPAEKREQFAEKLHELADQVAVGDQQAIDTLKNVGSEIMTTLKGFGLDPVTLLHKGVDFLASKFAKKA